MLKTEHYNFTMWTVTDITSRQLRAFLLVAEHRNFSRAAGRLFVTPSGLSAIIRELERQVNATLFERTTRHVSLTEAGEALLVSARRTLTEVDEVMAKLDRPGAAAPSPLRIGSTPLVANTVLPQAIREFRSRRPEFTFQLFDGDAATLMQRIEGGTLDIALGVFLKHLHGVRREPLFRFFLMAVRSNTLAGSRATIPWLALKRDKLLALDRSFPLQRLIDRHLARAGITQPATLELNSLYTLIAMAEAGEGTAVIPSFALPGCRHRAVVTSRLTQPPVYLDFHKIRRSGARLAAVAEEFVVFLDGYVTAWARTTGVE